MALTYNGIGTCDSAVLGYYQLKTKVFTKKLFDQGDYEIISLIGNFGTCNEKPCIHVHISSTVSLY
ncbi:PCC domain-containing protein [Clostridium sp. JNZ X4-2]